MISDEFKSERFVGRRTVGVIAVYVTERSSQGAVSLRIISHAGAVVYLDSTETDLVFELLKIARGEE